VVPQNRAGPPNRNNISRPDIPSEICKTIRFTWSSEHNLRYLLFQAAASPVQSHSFQGLRPSSLECSLVFRRLAKGIRALDKKARVPAPRTLSSAGSDSPALKISPIKCSGSECVRAAAVRRPHPRESVGRVVAEGG